MIPDSRREVAESRGRGVTNTRRVLPGGNLAVDPATPRPRDPATAVKAVVQ